MAPASVPAASAANDVDEELYRVLVLGGPGVGKTAITQQFLTSEYMAAQNTSFGRSISRLLTVRNIAMIMSVCLSVCLSARWKTTRPNFTKNVAVARSV